MKNMKNILQFRSGSVEGYRMMAEADITDYEKTLSDETPKLYTFLPDANKVVITVANDMKFKLNLRNNILNEYPLDSFPFGYSHQSITRQVELIIGIGSEFATLVDAIDYCAAIVENNSTDYIMIVKLVDKKFTQRNWYIISDKFAQSQYLSIDNIVTGDSINGNIIAEGLGKALRIDTDGIVI